MNSAGNIKDWNAASWEGSRRAQLRANLRLTIRERLEGLEALAEISRHFESLRKQGRFYYADHGDDSESRR